MGAVGETTCPNGHTNSADQRYCRHCGLALWVTCSNGHVVSSVVGACPACGAEVPVPTSPAVLASAPPSGGGAAAIPTPTFEPTPQPATGEELTPHSAVGQPMPEGQPQVWAQSTPKAPMNPQQSVIRKEVPRIPTASKAMRRRIIVGVVVVFALLVLVGACQAIVSAVSSSVDFSGVSGVFGGGESPTAEPQGTLPTQAAAMGPVASALLAEGWTCGDYPNEQPPVVVGCVDEAGSAMTVWVFPTAREARDAREQQMVANPRSCVAASGKVLVVVPTQQLATSMLGPVKVLGNC